MKRKAISNTLRNTLMAGFVFLCSYAIAQPDKAFLQVSHVSFIPDTAAAKIDKQLLNITLLLSEPDNVMAFSLDLTDDKGNPMVTIGSYNVKRHERGFYYVETEAEEKSTVLNNDIYLSRLVDNADIARVSNVRLVYRSFSGEELTSLTPLIR